MKETQTIEKICLQVLSRASASVTHEIKNTLSIINENAGYLDDLNQMGEQDEGGIPAPHIRHATDSIINQVSRANRIINNLNRFAHNLDTLVNSVNLNNSLSLLTDLTDRQAAMRKITVSVTCPSDCEITTCLFTFESCIYLILCQLYECIGNNSHLEIRVIENSTNIKLVFSSDSPTALTEQLFNDKDNSLLLQQLKGTLSCRQNTLELFFPVTTQKVDIIDKY